MPPLIPWQLYQRQVREVGADVFASLVDVRGPVSVDEEETLGGRNGPHRVDVLVRAGSTGLFLECKDLAQPLTKNALATTLYNFLDVCRGNPDTRWALGIVAPTIIPERARRPATRAEGIYSDHVPNLLGGSVAASTHFVYFRPPSGPHAAVPFFLDEEAVGVSGGLGAVGVVELWDRLNDPSGSLAARVDAGVRLAVRDPEILVRNYGVSRILIHGLMHLGRTEEALLVSALVDRGQERPVGAEIEALMMGFLLAQRRYPRARRPGARSIAAMRKLVGTVPLVDDVSIRAFIGPVIARWGDEEDGIDLMAGVESRVAGLEFEAAPYFELLRLVRTAQVSRFDSEREQLFEQARQVTAALPVWNRVIGEALITAVDANPEVLHGIDVPFDVEEWTREGAAWEDAGAPSGFG